MKMTISEIKKALYKQNPPARLQYILKGNAIYLATITAEGENYSTYKVIYFQVPVSEMGDTKFEQRMDSKLLIRYMLEAVDQHEL